MYPRESSRGTPCPNRHKRHEVVDLPHLRHLVIGKFAEKLSSQALGLFKIHIWGIHVPIVVVVIAVVTVVCVIFVPVVHTFPSFSQITTGEKFVHQPPSVKCPPEPQGFAWVQKRLGPALPILVSVSEAAVNIPHEWMASKTHVVLKNSSSSVTTLSFLANAATYGVTTGASLWENFLSDGKSPT